MEELEKCPFCGEPVKETDMLGIIHGFECVNEKCGAVVSFVEHETTDDSRRCWNTRQPRFTSSEIQAIEAVLKMAEQPEALMHFRGAHISRVRFMLAGKGAEQ